MDEGEKRGTVRPLFLWMNYEKDTNLKLFVERVLPA